MNKSFRWILQLLLIASCSFLAFQDDPESVEKQYAELLGNIEEKRQFYAEVLGAGEKEDSILEEAGEYLFSMITDSVFPLWYGTPWDFNGTTRIPRQGTIACGYFVTTVLQDVGFRLPRIYWAQQFSEYYIRRLALPPDIKAFSNVEMSVIEKHLEEGGNGLYIVGLDNHTGFITVQGIKKRFVHSNYYQSDIGVMSEKFDSGNPLDHSNFRLIGKILSRNMMRNWIKGIRYS